jgi:pyruvate kinase
MIKFSSTISDEITVEGLIKLTVKRNFKWLRTYDLKILQEDHHLLTISTTTDFLQIKYSIPHNETGFVIAVENDKRVVIDDDLLELKVEKYYPFINKYAEVWLNNKQIGEILFEKKSLNVVLNFYPSKDLSLNENKALKIAILVILNIVDLDGSE